MAKWPRRAPKAASIKGAVRSALENSSAKLTVTGRPLNFPAAWWQPRCFLEHYVAIPDRDDDSFRETLRAISYRAPGQPVYANGVQISDEKDVKRIDRLIEQAKESVAVLDEIGHDATEEEAAKAWKKVFRHSFFDEVAESTNSKKAIETKSAFGGAALASPHVAAKTGHGGAVGGRAPRADAHGC